MSMTNGRTTELAKDQKEITEKIQQWVKLDNNIKLTNKRLQESRKEKNEIGHEINDIIYKNNWQHAEIEISDGKLKFNEVKVTSPLTFGFLKECLSHFIEDEKQLNTIITYIKEQRQTKYNKDIKRVYNKK
tara:strand:- start:845 stop:1237 length:393 start_codon:yes stop_codon:yes gene_type:complete